jgi:hypothetical protein
VFDDLTHLVPVLYMGSSTNAPRAVATTLEATLTLRTRDNRSLPMVALLSWVLVDGRREGCALVRATAVSRITVGKAGRGGRLMTQCGCCTHARTHARTQEYSHLHNLLSAVGAFEAAHPGRVGAVALWSGSDHETSAPTSRCGKMDTQRSYEQWLRGAKIVPRACMPPRLENQNP